MKYILYGIKKLRSVVPALILIYIIQVFGVALVLSPFLSTLMQAFRSSEQVEKFMHAFDLSMFMEILKPGSPVYSSAGFTAMFGLVIIIALRLFFTGGFLHFIVHQYDRFSAVDFFGASARTFFPLVRFQIIAFVYYFLVFLLYGILFKGLSRYWETLPVERTVAIEKWVLLFVLFCLFVLVDTRLMYGRLALVRLPSRRVREALFVSKTEFTQRVGKAVLVYVEYFFTRLIVILVFTQVEQHISRETILAVLFLFLFEQGILFIQPFLKFAHYGSQQGLIQDSIRM